jgi:predicted alpha/beta-hydrolase family hydrolase
VAEIRTQAQGQNAGLVFIYAPGAGSNINDPFGVFLAPRLAEAGIETWRFEFPYMASKRGAPDRPPVLEASWNDVIERARAETGKRMVVGGRSMGGRIASQVVAGGTEVEALALFAYPLHPPGRPEQRRDAHLAQITCPTLFASGTRDVYATPDELVTAAALVPRATVHLLDGADHGFSVLKASGRRREDVWQEALEALFGLLGSAAD